MRRVVVAVLDGLRRDLITETHMPALARFAQRSQTFAAHRSMFPSATRVVSASFATGCTPARHELAGNTLALLEEGRLVYHDAGHPDFLQHKRRATGRSLAAPTLAERVAPHGGMILFSNVSPGAAYAHDPDGHGFIYHRAGSFGPGRKPLDGAQALKVGQDAAGETAMTRRFIDEALFERKPPLAILWMGEPDATQHVVPLGSPQHLAVLAQADANAARVIEAVDRLRDKGEEVLLILCSDHGHQTVSRVVDVEAELVAAGLKASLESRDVVTPTSGTSTLVYVHPEHAARTEAIGAFLAERDWVEAAKRRPGCAPWAGVRHLARVRRGAQRLRRARAQLRVTARARQGHAPRLRPARRARALRADAVPDDRRGGVCGGHCVGCAHVADRHRTHGAGASAGACRGDGRAGVARGVSLPTCPLTRHLRADGAPMITGSAAPSIVGTKQKH
jgi:hypothetical protein